MKPIGSFANSTFTAIRLGEQMQVLALQNIHSQFKTTKDKDFFELTFEDFLTELEDAYKNDTIDELNARYAAVLEPMITQFLMQSMMPQEGGSV